MGANMNNFKLKLIIMGLFIPTITWGVDSFYCPQHAGYINIGMPVEQVIAACGQPLSKQQMNTPATRKVPVQQVIYNNEGDKRAFYGVWSLPIGNSNTGILQPFGGNSGGGALLQITIMNNKVSSISINGASSNAFSVCGGVSVEIGDPVAAVYNACGTPSLVNHSYINQPIPSATKPEIWVYQPSPYQPPLSLTFIDGKLQSIN